MPTSRGAPADTHGSCLHASTQMDNVAAATAAAAAAAPAAEMPLAQVRASAAVLAGLLDESKDEQVLKETCLGLCQLFGEGIQNDRIQSILEADVVPRLVALLQPIHGPNGSVSFRVPVSIQSAALQVVGNIACGDDRQTQVIIDAQALPCLKSLLSSGERGIRKECCWIVSNITESAHQVQDVIDAGILPPLIKLLESGDAACREDATWVLYNVTANRDPAQIRYLSENCGVRALCGLLTCSKELDVLWKGCGTVAAVALKGIRNILVTGEDAPGQDNGVNKFAFAVAEAHGVERIEMLTTHRVADVRTRAQTILRAFFGSEGPTMSSRVACRASAAEIPEGAHGADACVDCDCQSECTTSTNDTDVEEEDSDLDLIPHSPPECRCVVCMDPSPLQDKRARQASDSSRPSLSNPSDSPKEICSFCCMDWKIGNSKSGLASKLGRAVRMSHTHCLAMILSEMSWSQRGAATDVPATLTPAMKGSGAGIPLDPTVTSTLPAVALAAQLGKPGCLRLLVTKCLPELDQTHGKKRLTPLAWAANKGHWRCCSILLHHGASAGARCADGWTALHLAASGVGSTAVCRLLIEYGAPVSIKSSKNQTPLCLAAQKGHGKVVRLLLDYGADARTEDDSKYTPLHLAALYGHVDVARALIAAGVEIDTKTTAGITALHYAVQGRHLSCVTLLLEAGAKVDNQSPGGSLLLIAADDGDIDCVKALLGASAAVDCRANIKVLINKDYEMMDYLAPLHLAASKGHLPVVNLLLHHGASVDDRSSKGWSALDFAVLNGHSACAMTLLGCGATVDEKPKVCGRGGGTLIQHAALSGSKELVRLLVERLQQQKVRGGQLSTTKPSMSTSVANEDFVASTRHTAQAVAVRPPPQSSSRRRRENKEVEKDSQKERDLRRRELEALEARDRLVEAMSQRSAPKLVDAITQVTKVVLQQAAGSESQSGKSTPERDIVAELGLGLEVERAGKLLTAIQADQRKAREERAAAVAGAKRESIRRVLAEATLAALSGGDPRSLTKTINRSRKSELDGSDEAFVKAQRMVDAIQKFEEAAVALGTAVTARDLQGLFKGRDNVVDCEAQLLVDFPGEDQGVSQRVFGSSTSERLKEVDTLIKELSREQEIRECALLEARRRESEAASLVTEAMQSGSLEQLEAALESASQHRASDSSELASVVSAARRFFTKACKAERKKLRQAATSKDLSAIDLALEAASKLNIRALDADVEGLRDIQSKRKEQREALECLEEAHEKRDISLLNKTRSRLNALGMFEKAEEVRALVDSLQRETRVRVLLSEAIAEAREILERYSDPNIHRELCNTWVWPDAQKLADLIRRAGRLGTLLEEEFQDAKAVAQQYSSLGRAMLEVQVLADDSRTISSAIEGYERAFLPRESDTRVLEEFDPVAGAECVARARERLSSVQSVEQEKILAESERLQQESASSNARRPSGGPSARPRVVSPVSMTSSDPGSAPERESHWVPPDDDGGFGDGQGSCAHYYLWKDQGVVECAKCGHSRASTNEEWLERVRRRTGGGSGHPNGVGLPGRPDRGRHSDPFVPKREAVSKRRFSVNGTRESQVLNVLPANAHGGIPLSSEYAANGVLHQIVNSVPVPAGHQPYEMAAVSGKYSVQAPTATSPLYGLAAVRQEAPQPGPQPVPSLGPEPSSSDLTVESFANEDFGFDIDAIVDDSAK